MSGSRTLTDNHIDREELDPAARESSQTRKNRVNWDAIAGQYDLAHSPDESTDGSEMFRQCLLPTVEELVGWQPGQTMLDLGTGTGILARRIEYCKVDLTDLHSLSNFMKGRKRFDIVVTSTTVKQLANLTPLAQVLPKMLKPDGRFVCVDLHPAFSKPAGHRVMEVLEDRSTGEPILTTSIKVSGYLRIPSSKSQAFRGQTQPVDFYHRPLQDLWKPFFRNGLVLDDVKEPCFSGPRNPSQPQNWTNFSDIPVLLGFRMVHGHKQEQPVDGNTGF